jgi:hypothetical protein
MSAIEALVLVVAAAFAVIIIGGSIVIIGIQQEERRGTIAYGNPPTAFARLTRRALGAHFCLGSLRTNTPPGEVLSSYGFPSAGSPKEDALTGQR